MRLTIEDALRISLALEDRANILERLSLKSAETYRDLQARWNDHWMEDDSDQILMSAE